ncbi:MAG: ECF-type sigma factor [Planctomycetota bacterium]
MPDDQAQITRLLARLSGGDPSAREELAPLVFAQLRAVAESRLGRERRGHTLQATALVGELWLVLERSCDSHEWPSRGHFYSWSSEVMASFLRDWAKHKRTAKAGGSWVRVCLDEGLGLQLAPPGTDLLDVLEAIDGIGESHPEWAHLIELRLFAGLSQTEIAETAELSADQVGRRLRVAFALLRQRLRSLDDEV